MDDSPPHTHPRDSIFNNFHRWSQSTRKENKAQASQRISTWVISPSISTINFQSSAKLQGLEATLPFPVLHAKAGFISWKRQHNFLLRAVGALFTLMASCPEVPSSHPKRVLFYFLFYFFEKREEKRENLRRSAELKILCDFAVTKNRIEAACQHFTCYGGRRHQTAWS